MGTSSSAFCVLPDARSSDCERAIPPAAMLPRPPSRQRPKSLACTARHFALHGLEVGDHAPLEELPRLVVLADREHLGLDELGDIEQTRKARYDRAHFHHLHPVRGHRGLVVAQCEECVHVYNERDAHDAHQDAAIEFEVLRRVRQAHAALRLRRCAMDDGTGKDLGGDPIDIGVRYDLGVQLSSGKASEGHHKSVHAGAC